MILSTNYLQAKTLCIMIAAVLLSNHDYLQMVFENIFYVLTKTYRFKDFTSIPTLVSNKITKWKHGQQ